jgi:hypothetical protein
LKYAKAHGHNDVYDWAISNGCPDDYASDTDEDDFDETEGNYSNAEYEDSNDSDQGDDEYDFDEEEDSFYGE